MRHRIELKGGPRPKDMTFKIDGHEIRATAVTIESDASGVAHVTIDMIARDLHVDLSVLPTDVEVKMVLPEDLCSDTS